MTAAKFAVLLGAHLIGIALVAWIQDRLAQRRHDARARLDRELVDALNAYNASKER
ncbi:hypothetical protein [Streptomyces sp. RTd22]|uniref:hypothetical protein n=1 Tax=Streptomyces sp. RTd22 TaxID=1841249 RepID=UPI000B103A5C|nr:hypothetical protein [Streptomyces sp. RTd22]